ncbi:MAG: DUF302 domain-containing protein [candidate division WOR-3 bacterium]|nr:MAG: DUF302 domain-containing protein [candidate division WOR-3 bacterium]
MDYGFVKKINLSFDDACARVESELKKEGFGILTTIDVKDKFREKLGIDFPRYMILGACNPKMAHKAISVEWNIGLLLPCNVIVYEKEGAVFVGIIRPTQAMGTIDNDALRTNAEQVETLLKSVFDRL